MITATTTTSNYSLWIACTACAPNYRDAQKAKAAYKRLRLAFLVLCGQVIALLCGVIVMAARG